ncbi:hypothetical protein [Flaviaesturariibacter aridisoli]|uniref:Uncharacterized protein n=1 Tax=Flaviaesturariibacter aridisoli TaxID=2545761 RepID=A0A4V2WMR4_9BACT|nr:hypothetical protein [Flaviaesturariibacter aridisoli]TCZ72257.1 hypothetical protein E0486_09205 [Flaviaesturariibacter aridisoli]
MAQVFNLDFTYRSFVHSAIITVRQVGNDHSVVAQILDSSLRHIVPDGELNFRLSNASRQPTAAPRPGYNELETALRTAVSQHLHRTAPERGLPNP